MTREAVVLRAELWAGRQLSAYIPVPEIRMGAGTRGRLTAVASSLKLKVCGSVSGDSVWPPPSRVRSSEIILLKAIR